MSRSEQPLILVVEDELNLREVLKFQLSASGFRVLEARNGREALGILGESLPDLILSDLVMPHMDGYQLLSAVRQHRLTERIPVIFLTAKAELEDRVTAFQLGANDYIVKPWDHRELRARIQALIKWTRGDRPPRR